MLSSCSSSVHVCVCMFSPLCLLRSFSCSKRAGVCWISRPQGYHHGGDFAGVAQLPGPIGVRFHILVGLLLLPRISDLLFDMEEKLTCPPGRQPVTTPPCTYPHPAKIALDFENLGNGANGSHTSPMVCEACVLCSVTVLL